MKIVALLTGRGNNTLKDKNVLPVLGKPLLYYPAMAAKQSKYIDDFFVSSEDDKILSAATEIGYKKIIRPKEFATPTAQHIDAIVHALKQIKSEGLEPDILVVLLANTGIIKTEWIDESIQSILSNPKLSASVPVKVEMDHHPYRAKKLREDGCLDTWVDLDDKSISTNRQDLPINLILCHNFWTLNVKESIEKKETGQKPWTFMGNNVKPIIVSDSFDVHTEEDIRSTEKWLIENQISY